MANYKPTWPAVGINHTPAYQVSGRPFASGGIDAQDAHKIAFPYVTRWVVVHNHSVTNVDLRVGYSELGISGSNYFMVPSGSSSPRLEVKVAEIWVYSPGQVSSVDVSAGLTTIETLKVSGSAGLSWSGSSGVG